MCMETGEEIKDEEIKSEPKKDWIGIVEDFPTDALKELKDMLKGREPLIIISFPVFGVMLDHVIEIVKDHENIVEETIEDVAKGKIATDEIICEVEEKLKQKLNRKITVVIVQKGCAVAVAFL